MSATDVANHLEFLGYSLDDGDGVFARHERYPNVRIVEKANGYLMVSWFGTQGDADQKLEFANALNQEAMCARFVIDKDGDFAMETWYPSAYDRTAFAGFMEMWHRDWAIVTQNPLAQAVLK